MADDYEFWAHGTAVVAQETPHQSGKRNGLFMMPLSWGTLIRQDPGSINYFHLPIPTPTRLDDWPSYYQSARLLALIGDHVEIRRVTVWSGNVQIKSKEFSQKEGPRGETLNMPLDLVDAKAKRPLVMTIKVEWDESAPVPSSLEDRSITFYGAGINFEEQR